MKIDGRTLKDLREQNGLSLRAFAQKIYASKSSVQRWEKSFLPNDNELIERIAKVFGITAEELEKRSNEKYGAAAEEKLSPERLAELKYGVKWLIFPLLLLPLLMVLGLITSIIILTV